MSSAPPDPFHAQLLSGLQLQRSGRHVQAEAVYRGVLQRQPRHPVALHLAGIVAGQLGRPLEAVQLLQQSVGIHPADPVAWNNLANALKDVGEIEAALAACDNALGRAPAYVAALHTRATLLMAQSRHAEAVQAFEAVLQQDPDHAAALGGLWRAKLESCDWPGLDALHQRILQGLAQGLPCLLPFEALTFSDDAALHRRCAQAFIDEIRAREDIRPMAHARRRPPRLRIAYVSADFHEHATAYLAAELFERHDRSRFEIIAISLGREDQSAMRARLRRAFDRFIEARDMTAAAIARVMADEQVDIAVDLKGYTRDGRPGIFLHRPAPIQVNFLGYPGTLGTDVFDYIIGDPVVTPLEHARHYAERIVQMPHCYQVNDGRRPIAAAVPSRAQEGLPETGFVFAAFNSSYKITPQFFDAWMRLLAAVPGSVLWLLGEHAAAQANLRHEAQRRGVAPQRLVFARRKPLPDHLARHALADLFLDNLPVNAHTTASDALWAGLPVLTCIGESFAGRVAASLLAALQLPELVVNDVQAYESMALRLAQEPKALAALRARLAGAREGSPLFDARRFAAHLESAFEQMHERWRAGLPPEHIAMREEAAASH
ncbi:tetratricopeptide repeat protein [Acidovorax sp. NCPPB 2350]|nr:tetratricopeptide repeat protein [Acidovorax sp. NCPPB 2350]